MMSLLHRHEDTRFLASTFYSRRIYLGPVFFPAPHVNFFGVAAITLMFRNGHASNVLDPLLLPWI